MISLRVATQADGEALAAFNAELNLVQKSRNTTDVEALADRFRQLFREGYCADLLVHGDEAVGYCLHGIRETPFEPSGRSFYIRQFMLTERVRGRGLGRLAFETFSRERIPPGMRICLDVLASNPQGRGFWEALGFTVYSAQFESRAPMP